MPREEKVSLVNQLRQEIESSSALVLTDYRGLTMSEMAALRRKLHESGAEYRVVKNTLFKLASEGVLDSRIVEMLEGPTAVAFVRDDALPSAKAIAGFMKEHKALSIKGGYVEGHIYDGSQMEALSKVPARSVLISQLIGWIQSPLANLVYTCRGLTADLVYTLQAVAGKKAA